MERELKRCVVMVSEDQPILLELYESATLDDCRNMINSTEHIAVDHIVLSKGNQELTDPIVDDLKLIGQWPCDMQVKMKVNVTMMSGETFSVQVYTGDDVLDLMWEIDAHTGYWPDQQCLVWGSTKLARRVPLTVYGIDKNPKLSLAVKQLGPFRIVDREDGELFTMTVEPGDTIKDVKDKLTEAEGTVADCIMLFHDGEALMNFRTLASYNLDVTSTVEAYFFAYSY